jgi:hypothetical protein
MEERTMTTFFVRPDHHYQPYVDYWRLVELAHYPIISVGNIEASNPEHTYILTMQNLDAWQDAGLGWPDAKARIVYWDLEWRDRSYQDTVPGLNEFWTSDRWYAEQRGYDFVPLGSHALLVNINASKRWQGNALWDVCILSYMGPPRRQTVVNKIEQRRYRVAPNSAWDGERIEQLERSRLMLHIHQHDAYRCVAAQRFALAAAAGIPLISEDCHDPYPFIPGEDFISASADDLPGAVATALDNGWGRDIAAKMLYKACSEYRFDRNVERALEGVRV